MLPSTYTEEPAQDGDHNVVLRRVGAVGMAGLVYHIGFCVAASAVLGLMVVYVWPPGVSPGVPAAAPPGTPLGVPPGAARETRPIPPPRGQGEHG